MSSTVSTPCIGVCSTGIGDSVCRGCKRFAHEIIQWNSYSDVERGSIVQRIDSLRTRIMAARVEVFDEQRLRAVVRQHHVRCKAALSIHSIAYEAVCAMAGSVPSLEALGCRAIPPWDELRLVDLKTEIEESFYRLCCAHYERYFPGCI